jgi:hypothetical protein
MSKQLVATLYDVETAIPELFSRDDQRFTEPIGLILNLLEVHSAIVRGKFSQYFSNLTVAPYITYPVSRKRNSNKNSYLKKPVLLQIGDREADTFLITFTSATNYTVSDMFGQVLDSGTIQSNYTSSDDTISIPSTNWVGTFATGDMFTFAYQNYEHTLRLLCTYYVASALVDGRFVSEDANSMVPLQTLYGDKAKALVESILSGRTVLESQKSGEGQPPSSMESWHGYPAAGNRFGLG